MSATLLLESTKYQVFDLGYGIVLVDRNVEEINIPFSKESLSTTKDSKGHLSVFFQGDDYINFSNEIENINKNKLNDEKINFVLGQYEDVMSDLLSFNDYDKIGINVKRKNKIK